MRYPNSFGSVIKLGGRRRKKFAVRISTGHRERICLPNKAEWLFLIDQYPFTYVKGKNIYVMYCDNDDVKKRFDELGVPYRIEYVRSFRYLGYFSKSKDAHSYLARYNATGEAKEHVSLSSEPSFKAVYRQYIQFVQSLNKPPSEATLRAYQTGFNLWADVHDIRFRSVTTKMLQDCLTKHGTMSKASVTRMITVLKKMYRYGIANQITDKDLSKYLFSEYSSEKKYAHTIYTDEEIDMLWKRSDYEGAAVMLVMIYLGVRCSEFLQLRTENIHLDERYLIGGMKTEAGRNRIIPIHQKIVPLMKRFYNPDNEWFFPSQVGKPMQYNHFRDNKWKAYNKELGLAHKTHDCRHTCATLLEKYNVPELHRKLILGHTVRDITLGVYTHVSTEDLINSIDLVEIKGIENDTLSQ